jgi:nucleoside-diphosphate-sugar epimerase
MPTILITGANGFIGAQYARRMKSKDWNVIGADLQAAPDHNACSQYLSLDVSAADALERLEALPQPDLILHAGGISGFMVATDRPRHIVDVNVSGTMPLLTLAQRCGVRRTVLCSTIMVYGPNAPIDQRRDESEYPKPASIYGASKISVEALMHGHQGQYGTDAIALRFSHVYGPGRTTQCFIRDMLSAAREGHPCKIPHASRSLRQYVHIDDVCQSIDRAFGVDNPSERVFNISADEIHTLADVVQVIWRVTGRTDVQFDENNDPMNYRIGPLSIERARKILGYRPALSLEAGIERYWKESFSD